MASILLYVLIELPLIKMDLTGFINVTDSGVMHHAGARRLALMNEFSFSLIFWVIESDLFYFSLTFLSLSGMKLTDVGMSALKGT